MAPCHGKRCRLEADPHAFLHAAPGLDGELAPGGNAAHAPRGARGRMLRPSRRLRRGAAGRSSPSAHDFFLGDGVNGVAGICHGGLIGLMLDETTGQLAAEVFGRYNILTAAMTVAYKRRLLSPAVVLCRAWLAEEVKGRTVKVDGTVEDGMGGVYATGQTVFVKCNPKL